MSRNIHSNDMSTSNMFSSSSSHSSFTATSGGTNRLSSNTNAGGEEKSTADIKQYTIKTFTGTSLWAGTDANVFITLYGSNQISEEINLKNSLDHSDPFEKGNKDTFKRNLPDLGFIYRIKIRHDNTGYGPAWLLNKVEVVDSKEMVYKFTYYDWVFKSRSLNELDHFLDVDGFPVCGVDPLIEENTSAHHTDKFQFEDASLILRRGQSFKIGLKIARPYESDDDFYFTLKTGERPRDKDKTLITVTEVLPKDFDNCKIQEKWGFTVRDTSDPKNIIVEVFIPPKALPAKYEVLVETDEGTIYQPESPIYILFNPWCKEDEVYMESEEELREYILKQNGQVYIGSYRNPRFRRWYYGQFEEISLKTAIRLLEDHKAQDRDSAIEVSRIVSSKVNSNDNNGVLVGNWSGEYDDGKTPTFWNSTPAILENYMVENLPVKYGQCWVFSSITTTIMRALGIPCRPVTNFSSAHDSDFNCSNDRYIDADGELIEEKSHDSVWNFHVWNDVWMARPDLPVGYGGWQAIDATPQEMSQGLFQMGPASLRAVKEGAINLPYDTGFVLAEVNADTIYWQRNEEGEFEPVHRNRSQVGRKISTKACGSDYRNDVTDCYKFAEGSVLERASVRNALIKSGNKAVKSTRQDIEMELILEKGDDELIMVGEDVTLHVKVKNTCNEDLPIKLAVAGQIVRYDGVSKARLANFKKTVTIKANSAKDIPICVKGSTYVSKLEDDTMLRFLASLNVEMTKQVIIADEVIDLVKPSLEMNGFPAMFKSNKDHKFSVSFTNPLDIELTRCEMYIDGSIIKNRIFYDSLKNIQPNGKFQHVITLRPEAVDVLKTKSIVISFSCKELGGLHADKKVKVES